MSTTPWSKKNITRLVRALPRILLFQMAGALRPGRSLAQPPGVRAPVSEPLSCRPSKVLDADGNYSVEHWKTVQDYWDRVSAFVSMFFEDDRCPVRHPEFQIESALNEWEHEASVCLSNGLTTAIDSAVVLAHSVAFELRDSHWLAASYLDPVRGIPAFTPLHVQHPRVFKSGMSQGAAEALDLTDYFREGLVRTEGKVTRSDWQIAFTI